MRCGDLFDTFFLAQKSVQKRALKSKRNDGLSDAASRSLKPLNNGASMKTHAIVSNPHPIDFSLRNLDYLKLLGDYLGQL